MHVKCAKLAAHHERSHAYTDPAASLRAAYKKRIGYVCLAVAGLTTFQLLGPSLVAYAIDTGINVQKDGAGLRSPTATCARSSSRRS